METTKIRGLPTIEKAPSAFMARIKQPFSGIISLLIPLIISWGLWQLFFNPQSISLAAKIISIPGTQRVLFAPLLGGFGLIGVIWNIWYENWPLYEYIKKPWLVGLLGTILNIGFTALFVFILTPIFTTFYDTQFGITSDAVADYIGKSIFGALSGSCFSFGLLWVAGSMYWPIFKWQQPQRGLIVWLIGTVITIGAWVGLFFFNSNPGAPYEIFAIKDGYFNSLGLTQWTIFYSLLTMLIFEYWPWDRLGKKQPWIGILTFIGCGLLGWGTSVGFLYVVEHLFDPIFLAWAAEVNMVPGMLIPITRSWQTMSISYADFLICAIVAIALFFDNWPKKYSQGVNFLLRFLLVLGLGTMLFFVYYRFAFPLFGDAKSPYLMAPTHFIVWFLWIEFIFAQLWRKWPLYKAL